jgi:hypothetical protein
LIATGWSFRFEGEIMTRTTIVLLMFTVLLPQLPSAVAKEPKEAAKIDPAIVDAWTKRGAEALWHPQFRVRGPLFRAVRPPDPVDALPSFRFPKGDDLDLSDLPAVPVPFAIVLDGTQITPATLKGVKKIQEPRADPSPRNRQVHTGRAAPTIEGTRPAYVPVLV